MIKHVERVKRLKVVAAKLGDGWVSNEILSEDSRGYILNNRKGLFLIVRVVYGSTIEKWELCIKNDNYRDYYPIICSIGCSLQKSDSAIISDLKNRLLSSESLAYKKLMELAKEKGFKAELIENRKHVIDSVSKVLSIKKSPHQRGDLFNILNSDDEKIGGFDHLHNQVDKFNLNLRGVSSENIIQIMGLIAQK
jgi:hypothetical protein